MRLIRQPAKPKHFQYYLLITFLVNLYGINNVVYSQLSKIDSLKQLISTQQENKEKVDNLLVLVNKLAFENPDEARQFCNQAMRLSERMNYTEGVVEAIYVLGKLQSNIGQKDSAIYYLGKYFMLCDSLYDDYRQVKAYSLYGNLMRSLGQYDTAILYYRKSLNYYGAVADTFKMIINYNVIGISFKDLAQYDSAIFYYMKTIELCDLSGRENIIGSPLINIGKVHKKRNEFSKAKEYLARSIEVNSKYNSKANLALTYVILGNIANEETKLEEALEYYQKADDIYQKENDTGGINDLHLNYGEVYQKQGKYQVAIQNYNKALEYYESIDHYNGIITAKSNKAAIFVKLKRYDQAAALYDTCLNLAHQSNDIYSKKRIYGNLSDLMQRMGNYKKAFQYLSEYLSLNDSIFNLEKEKIIADMQLKYERQVDQAKILEQELDLKKRTNQRNIYLFSGIGAVIVLLLLFSYHKNASRKNKIIAEQKIKQLEEEKKLLAAKFLVEGQEVERKRIAKELHDGLGVLLSTAKMQFTTIKDKSPENRPLIERATKLLEQATSDVRRISHNMMPGLLTKYGFYEAVEDLFEQVDDTEGLTARAEISGDQKRLPENTEIMLYRVVQEMVNNTIKHAGASEVNIDIVVLPEQLSIDYADNGKGFEADEMFAKKSIGLTSIKSRVKFLNGHLDVHAKADQGVNYHITIPLKV
nr:sensor histidine kinase [Bacteroidota bacterium]